MRYRDTGQVHLDFHRTLNGTIAYLRQTHGQAFLDAVLRRTAHDVYRAIWDDLKRGDTRQLVEHWTYYLERDGGDYRLEHDGNRVRLTVLRCPAIDYLRRQGIPVDPAFCRQTVVVNQAWSEDTPFEIVTEVLGDGRCVQTVNRVKPGAVREGAGGAASGPPPEDRRPVSPTHRPCPGTVRVARGLARPSGPPFTGARRCEPSGARRRSCRRSTARTSAPHAVRGPGSRRRPGRARDSVPTLSPNGSTP